jgi:hypothetical protein
MKNSTTRLPLILFCINFFVVCCIQAQDGTEFDFWVGNWNLNWEYPDSSAGHGINKIEKTLDGKVIREHFEALDKGPYSGFKGTSLSVFNPNSNTWHQAWADNQGGYFNFIGDVSSGQRIFSTTRVQPDGQEIILRMRFYDIEEDSLTWDWEQSTDGGKTWTSRWRIFYKRRL